MNSQAISQTIARHIKTTGALPQSILRTVLEPLWRFRIWRDRRLAIRDLERLDDRLLADIGLDRGQIRFVIDGLAPRRGDLAPKGAASRAREIDTEREKKIPDINKALRDLSNQVLKVLSDEDSKVIKFRELNETSEYASFRELKYLHLEFLALASRAKSLAEEINVTEQESYGKTIEENEQFARSGGNSGELVQLR